MVASEFAFKEARGIEFSPLLCDVAKKNSRIYKEKTQTKTNIVVICSDAIDYKFNDDEDVFFFFNPFDDHIMKKVVQNIFESLQRKKRKTWIIYRNALFKESIEKGINVTKKSEFLIWGQDFVIYEVE